MTVTKQSKAQALTFSQELRIAVHLVWQQIGQDCYSCAEECGESIDNGGAVEACIDAGRLHPDAGFVRGDAAHKELRAMIDAHGYHAVHKALCKAIRLA